MIQIILKVTALSLFLSSISSAFAASPRKPSATQRETFEAQPPNPEALKRNKENAAKKACSTGDYKTGVDILADLFIETNDPVLIHNQARCYQQNGQFDLAILRFQEFLRKVPELPEKDRVVVDKYINECEIKLTKTSPSPVVSEPEPATSQAEIPIATLSKPTSVPKVQDPGRGLRMLGIGTMALGVVGLGTGVTFNILERNLHDKMKNPLEKTKENFNTREHYERIGWIGYSIGATCVVTGLILYLIGQPEKSDETTSSIAFFPRIGPGLTMFSIRGAF